MKSDREVRLERALGHLIRRYWLNKGTDSEFIQVITCKGVPDYWREAEDALRDAHFCNFCGEEAIVQLNENWVCKDHLDYEAKRIGETIRNLVTSLQESLK